MVNWILAGKYTYWTQGTDLPESVISKVDPSETNLLRQIIWLISGSMTEWKESRRAQYSCFYYFAFLHSNFQGTVLISINEKFNCIKKNYLHRESYCFHNHYFLKIRIKFIISVFQWEMKEWKDEGMKRSLCGIFTDRNRGKENIRLLVVNNKDKATYTEVEY